jgi:hypothetical protein
MPAGLVWWQRGQAYWGGVQAASDVLGLLFFILLFPSMRALFRALFTFPNEQRMLMKVRLPCCRHVVMLCYVMFLHGCLQGLNDLELFRVTKISTSS